MVLVVVSHGRPPSWGLTPRLLNLTPRVVLNIQKQFVMPATTLGLENPLVITTATSEISRKGSLETEQMNKIMAQIYRCVCRGEDSNWFEQVTATVPHPNRVMRHCRLSETLAKVRQAGLQPRSLFAVALPPALPFTLPLFKQPLDTRSGSLVLPQLSPDNSSIHIFGAASSTRP